MLEQLENSTSPVKQSPAKLAAKVDELSDQVLFLEKQLNLKQLQINALEELTQAINNNFSAPAILRIYEFIMLAQLGVQKLLVFRKGEDWECICRAGVTEEQVQLSVKKDLTGFVSTTRFSPEHPVFSPFEVVVPVLHKGIPLAYLLLGGDKGNEYADDETIKFIQTITNMVIVAIENKRLFETSVQQELMKKELELAAKMQSMLIPYELPNTDKLEMAAFYRPHQDIGGDFYDCMQMSDHEVGFCIGDISGKGVSAALLMANFQANIRSTINQYSRLDEYVRNINMHLEKLTRGERFITVFFGVYNLLTRELLYVNAGHNPSILFEKNQVLELEKGCTILGMFDKLPSVEIGRVVVGKNALLINYTDGLIDVENTQGEFYGLDRMKQDIYNLKDLPAKNINESLLSEIDKFRGNISYSDDMTLLTCRFY